MVKKSRVRRRRGEPEDVGLKELVYSRAGKILLLKLHPELQRLLQGIFLACYAVILMWDGFPDRLPGSKTRFYMQSIEVAVARAEPSLPEELTQYAKTCTDWMREISTLVMYICLLRGFSTLTAL